jgi:hypothetical protein
VLPPIKPAEDYELLQSDIDLVQKWCIENYIKISILKTNIISFARKTNGTYFNDYIGDVRTDCVKYLGFTFYINLHFLRHIAYKYSRALTPIV